MIDIDRDCLETVKKILAVHFPDCDILVFGSRVTGRAHRYSDLDLVLVGKEAIDRHRLEALRDDFAESNLPFTVDVMDWHALSDSFRQVINDKFVLITSRD